MDSVMVEMVDWGYALIGGAESRRLIGDVFSDDQLKSGAVIIYVPITLYTFLGLSIVCDEFFVPALEVISARLELPNDVAGATFMAAGGSAPEFFTSLIGNFLGDASVGISTIVGSAVFNVLLVIGACAFVAPEPLALTWFPLARDSAFYAVDLCVLSLFFLDEKIMFWEAIILFLLYIAYCVFMVYTSRIEEWAYSKFGRPGVDKAEDDTITVSLAGERVDPSKVNDSGEPAKVAEEGGEVAVDGGQLAEAKPAEEKDQPKREDNNEAEKTDKVVPKPSKPKALDRNDDYSNDINQNTDYNNAEEAPVEDKEDISASTATKKAKKKAKNPNGEQKLKKKRLSKASAATTEDDEEVAANPDGALQPEAEHNTAWCGDDVDDDASVDQQHYDVELTLIGSRHLHADVSHAAGNDIETIEDNGDELKDAKKNSKVEDDEDDDEENEPLEISWPADGSISDKIYFVFAVPLYVALSFTIPDVRREGREKFFAFSFILSISWIAVFTYLMVESITVISDVLKIPVTIFALTIVAAGTSVPDMLTSIIVARKGRGDMAVSSSIGSNIFDVTVGMPVPWLVYMACKGISEISVVANGLLFSVVLLLGMLVVTILAIMACKWVMNQKLGCAMVILYIVFLVVCLIKMY